MARYYFDLSDGNQSAMDDSGTDLPDDRAAIAYGHEIAHDLMRNDEKRRRQFCISVCDETRQLLFQLPFAGLDETIADLSPEARTLLEVCYERRRGLAEAIHGARTTIRQSRAVVARSRGKPYLATVNGRACL
jgi:hypothetical protein